MDKKNREETIDRVVKSMRRGTYIIIKARTNAHYQSIVSVFTNRRYWNEEMVRLAKEINGLSDEDFAVELVRSKKIVESNKKKA
jgi:hypothetical protein